VEARTIETNVFGGVAPRFHLCLERLASDGLDLDSELVALLREWRANSKSEFVITSERSPRHDRSRTNYRCATQFSAVYQWLRAHSITARKPLHELRKQLGALLASKQGIFAAQRVLRHAQISTTAACYADKKQRISAGLDSLLAVASKKPK
jgi:hypothetical protein